MRFLERIATEWGYLAYKNVGCFTAIVMCYVLVALSNLLLIHLPIGQIIGLILIIIFIPILVVALYGLFPQINLKIAIEIGEKFAAKSNDREFRSKIKELIQEAENKGKTKRVRKWQKYMAKLEKPVPFFDWLAAIFFQADIRDEEREKIKIEIKDNV